jgi:predicted MFS family arabinose efflux permease
MKTQSEIRDARKTGGIARLRFLVYALCLVSATFQQGIVPLLPDYAHRFGLLGLQEGMLLGSTAFATMAVSVPAGALSDRLGARRLTLIASSLMTVAMLMEAFAPSFSVLLMARLVFGVGYGIVWTAGLAWLAGVSAEGSGLGGTVACSGVGGIIGPVLAGSLAQLVGLAAPFVVAAVVLAAITAVLGAVRLPTPAPAVASPGFRHCIGGIIGNGGIVAATAAVVIAGLTWSVSYLLVPQELHTAGVSAATIGLVLSAAAVVFVIGSTAVSSVRGRAIRPKVIFLAILLAAVAFIPGVISTAPVAATAVLVGSAVARSVLWTVCYPLAARGAERTGIGVGVVMGYLQAVWAVTSVISPLAAGALTGSIRPQAIFSLTTVSCLVVLSCSVAWFYRRQLQARTRVALERAGLAM